MKYIIMLSVLLLVSCAPNNYEIVDPVIVEDYKAITNENNFVDYWEFCLAGDNKTALCDGPIAEHFCSKWAHVEYCRKRSDNEENES